MYATYIKLYPTEKELNIKKKNKENLNSWDFKLISDVANRIIAELKQLATFLITSKYKCKIDVNKRRGDHSKESGKVFHKNKNKYILQKKT